MTGPEPALIDSGPPGGLARVLAALRGAGIPAGGIRHVAVTHHHSDHTGNLAALSAASTGAVCYAHPDDAGIVRADRPRGAAHGPIGRIMQAMASGSSRAEPAPVHVEVEDGEELPAAGGLRCIHTPGHTGGHVSFLWPGAGGVLFAGDAAANMLRRLDIAPLNEDDASARASFAKLAGLEFEVACFGHGPPIRRRAVARFRRRLDRLANP